MILPKRKGAAPKAAVACLFRVLHHSNMVKSDCSMYAEMKSPFSVTTAMPDDAAKPTVNVTPCTTLVQCIHTDVKVMLR